MLLQRDDEAYGKNSEMMKNKLVIVEMTDKYEHSQVILFLIKIFFVYKYKHTS
jgi:hypothetical protein